MGYEATGQIHHISETQQITERFRKREFVLTLEPDSRYPQYVQFQLTGDRCEALDGVKVGDVVGVEFTLRGREWTSPQGDIRYFNSLDAWQIELQSSGGGGTQEELPAGSPKSDDDIPF